MQKSENARLRSRLVKISDLRTELKQKIVELEQRMTEVEQQIGTKEDDPEDGLNNFNGTLD